MNQNNKPAELSYYGLYLLSYLKENHPDKAHDAAFIENRSDHAADVYEQARFEGYLPEGAHELAMAELLEGLRFSKYDTIIEVLWNECSDEVAQSDAPSVALRLCSPRWRAYSPNTRSRTISPTRPNTSSSIRSLRELS